MSNPQSLRQQGDQLRAGGRLDDAADSYRRALQLDPNLHEARNGLGGLLLSLARLDEAAEHFRFLVTHGPVSAGPLNNLGCVLLMQKRDREAIDCFTRAIALEPREPDAYLNLGTLLSNQGEHEAAARQFEAGYDACPGCAALADKVLHAMQKICDWSRFREFCERRLRDVVESPEQRTSPFTLLSIPSTPGQQLACATRYAADLIKAAAAANPQLAFAPDAESERRLRVGYLSADFREHVVAYVACELLELHDRDQVEVIAYSYGPNDGSLTRAQLEHAVDRFVDIAPLSDVEAAGVIHADRIDILVDLTGYTTEARPAIAALRPAPIQASYLGFLGTMGADFIDYIITDEFALKQEHASAFSEQPFYLPYCSFPRDRSLAAAEMPSRAELELPSAGFVFCCFNQTLKILPDTFAVWMRLLRSVPDSVLWLAESNRWATGNLRREAAHHSVDPERLVIAPRVAPDQNLGRLRAADLVLDTLPYNANATASDALWVGVPVLTCPGETVASRVAGSQLIALDMAELVADSMQAYEATAVRLARDPRAMAEIKRKLARNRTRAPLFDMPRLVRHLELGYREMWRIHASGRSPRPIRVKATP